MPDKPSSDAPAPLGEEASCPLIDSGAAEDACPLGPPLPADTAELGEGPDVAEKPGAFGETRTGRIAALIYTGISSLAAAVFILVTTYIGSYPPVARYGGAAWIFLLLMIVLMPFVIPRVRKWQS